MRISDWSSDVCSSDLMGTLHARNATANARFQLALIADQHAPSAKRLAAETGAEIGTVDTMLDDPTIAGIIVVSSTDAHLDHARAALTVGKAVFCEKPQIGSAHV